MITWWYQILLYMWTLTTTGERAVKNNWKTTPTPSQFCFHSFPKSRGLSTVNHGRHFVTFTDGLAESHERVKQELTGDNEWKRLLTFAKQYFPACYHHRGQSTCATIDTTVFRERHLHIEESGRWLCQRGETFLPREYHFSVDSQFPKALITAQTNTWRLTQIG